MKKLMIAVAMTIALPGAAFAQAKPATPAPAANAHAGHDMHGMQTMSCKDMQAMMAAQSGHQMDHSKMAACDTAKAGAAQAPANPHANHKK